ncbi:uncharacterized protein E5676_scaffold436G00020 [Cucumis melo var. makuwa]|uniref:Uncharacterized protein n=1 Tax=Cucumis melo var. makuwa TaxID=1194695 RepID=A0A5A7SQV1_CUCMM|nr:uncharacterized protein E6C27_scaffold225G00130 [Cucumis melo var. makuwa]TYK25802.1 uncharacterized protein E5676_scaffold436G00020 [Cucumis melo var. makuwa]
MGYASKRTMREQGREATGEHMREEMGKGCDDGGSKGCTKAYSEQGKSRERCSDEQEKNQGRATATSRGNQGRGKALVFVKATDQRLLDDVTESSNSRIEKKSGGLTQKRVYYFYGKPEHIKPQCYKLRQSNRTRRVTFGDGVKVNVIGKGNIDLSGYSVKFSKEKYEVVDDDQHVIMFGTRPVDNCYHWDKSSQDLKRNLS